MTAAQQHRLYGACAEASGDMVIIQVGNAMKALTPKEARAHCKNIARELFRAEMFAFGQELDSVRQAEVKA